MCDEASSLNLQGFGEQFLLYLERIAPNIGVNQQTVYLFLLGEAYHSGSEIVTFSMKTARFQMGKGTGDADKPMAENTVTECVQKLCQVKLLERIDSGRFGTRVRVKLPKEAISFHKEPFEKIMRSIEEIDFFLEPAARVSILEREHQKCFYCARSHSKTMLLNTLFRGPWGITAFVILLHLVRSATIESQNKGRTNLFGPCIVKVS